MASNGHTKQGTWFRLDFQGIFIDVKTFVPNAGMRMVLLPAKAICAPTGRIAWLEGVEHVPYPYRWPVGLDKEQVPD